MSQTEPKTYKVKVTTTLIKSQAVYKGPFETVQALNSVNALDGDYADVYETNTRWQYKSNAWTNTNEPIPVNSQYVQTSEVSVDISPNSIVKRDENGRISIDNPTALQHGANKSYVDGVISILRSEISAKDAQQDNSVSQVQIELNNEITRAIGKESDLENSIVNFETELSNETQRATNEEEAIKQNVSSVETNLQDEVNRATQAENDNSQKIEAEEIRAKAQENELEQKINALAASQESGQAKVEKSISDETIRATQAEQALSNEISTKLTEITDSNDKLRAYTINTDGEQLVTIIDTNASNDSLVIRNSQGQVNVADPTEDSNAVTKKYVDSVDAVHQTQLQQIEEDLANETERGKTAEGILADAIDEETKRAKQAEKTNTSKISTNTSEINAVKTLIPSAASSENQLADKDFVNSSIANNASNYVTASASGDSQFASLDALNAGPWYLRGVSYLPTKNDYALFTNTDGSTWRAIYDGLRWVASYKVNDTPFTAAQLEAINSGVTANLLATITNDIANRVVMSALASVLYATDASGNQITKALSDFATAAQGIKADTAYQKPSTGIPENDLAINVKNALALARTALQSFTEKDPTVPAWAKNATKPSYTKSEVGLGNVDNTSDMNKPVSTLQKAAIDAVQEDVDANTTKINNHIANKNNPHGVTASQIGAEPAFTKNTAFNKNFGSAANTVCQGNDARLSNSRTPTEHASNQMTYGVGTDGNYGHVQLSGNDTNSVNNGSHTALRYKYVSNRTVNLNTYLSEGQFTLYNVTTRTNFPASATVPTTPSYYLEVKRCYSNTEVIQVLYVRGTTEVWIRYSTSATVWGAWQRVGGSSRNLYLHKLKLSFVAYGDLLAYPLSGSATIEIYNNSLTAITNTSFAGYLLTYGYTSESSAMQINAVVKSNAKQFILTKIWYIDGEGMKCQMLPSNFEVSSADVDFNVSDTAYQIF